MKNTPKTVKLYNYDILDTTAERKYIEKNLPECLNIKLIVAELLSCLFLKPCKSKIIHHKIKKQVVFWENNFNHYTYVKYDKYGYFKTTIDGLGSYEFMADSGIDALEKYEKMIDRNREFQKVMQKEYHRRYLIWSFRRKNDKSEKTILPPLYFRHRNRGF